MSALTRRGTDPLGKFLRAQVRQGGGSLVPPGLAGPSWRFVKRVIHERVPYVLPGLTEWLTRRWLTGRLIEAQSGRPCVMGVEVVAHLAYGLVLKTLDADGNAPRVVPPGAGHPACADGEPVECRRLINDREMSPWNRVMHKPPIQDLCATIAGPRPAEG